MSKAIDSPYKSLLKLLLTEAYASEHPRVRCVALRFKSRYSPASSISTTSWSIAISNATCSRRRNAWNSCCLYLKVGKLGGRQRQAQKGWQHLSMERLVAEWQWEPRRLALLDSRSQWKMRQVMEERRTVVNELTYSYPAVPDRRQQGADSGIDSRDLGLLGRRLYAAFERKAGKVEHQPGDRPGSRRRRPDPGPAARRRRPRAGAVGDLPRCPGRSPVA
ncbi:class I adenylate cyclase [Pseudomonas aeruginosa]|uniref:class I adenylate cyclase n=1 Tax=Pseudomonas aeruginosa TaxID=287 RepID=UPI0021C5FDD3|nr:class I adenylate cyclase [Pseudomonas aeruginosa]